VFLPMSVPMSRLAWIPATVAVAVVLSASANASRPPSSGERLALRTTITAYIRAKTPEVTRFQVKSVRISTVDATWAAVRIEGWRHRRDIGPATVVLHDAVPQTAGDGGKGQGGGKGNGKGKGSQKHNSGGAQSAPGWHVVAFGTVSLGCGLPPAVQSDLHLACP
jgi:hypothetical protein